jgi:hypothetical protein
LNSYVQKCDEYELIHGFPMCLKCKPEAMWNEEQMKCVDCATVGCKAGCASYFTDKMNQDKMPQCMQEYKCECVAGLTPVDGGRACIDCTFTGATIKDGECQCIDSKKEVDVESESCELKDCYAKVQIDEHIKHPLCVLNTCVELMANCPTGVDALIGVNPEKKCAKLADGSFLGNECNYGLYMTLDGTCIDSATCETKGAKFGEG